MIHTISRAVLLGCASLLAAGAAQAQTPPSHSHTPADEAEGRRYTVDDMLAVEAFGKATLDPSGRKVVFERLAAHEQLIRYDLGYYSPYTASTLWVADVGAGTARPLLPPSADHGLKIGAWSPSGRWLLVHRIGAEAWDAGVVEVETGAVRWLNLHPESEAFGRTLQWRSDDELIAIHRPRGGFAAQAGAQPTALEAARKRRAAGVTGRFSGTRLGAGAFAEEPLAESNEIVAINVATGTRRTLASGRFLDLELSPDGGWLAALEIGAAPPLDLDRPVHGLERPNARRLHLVEISTGERIPLCETCNPAASLMSWSPDGRRLLIWDRTSPDPDRGRLLALTPADDALEVFALGDLTPGVEPDAGLHDMIRAHWIGDRPAIRARRSGDARRATRLVAADARGFPKSERGSAARSGSARSGVRHDGSGAVGRPDLVALG